MSIKRLHCIVWFVKLSQLKVNLIAKVFYILGMDIWLRSLCMLYIQIFNYIFLVLFSVPVLKCPEKYSLMEKGCMWLTVLGYHPSLLENSRGQNPELACWFHYIHVLKENTKLMDDSQCSDCLNLTQAMMPLLFRVYSPISISLIQKSHSAAFKTCCQDMEMFKNILTVIVSWGMQEYYLWVSVLIGTVWRNIKQNLKNQLK